MKESYVVSGKMTSSGVLFFMVLSKCLWEIVLTLTLSPWRDDCSQGHFRRWIEPSVTWHPVGLSFKELSQTSLLPFLQSQILKLGFYASCPSDTWPLYKEWYWSKPGRCFEIVASDCRPRHMLEHDFLLHLLSHVLFVTFNFHIWIRKDLNEMYYLKMPYSRGGDKV